MRFLIAFITFLFLTAASSGDARKANQAFENGNYEEAARLYQQALAADPSDARLHFNYGNALYHLGEADQAREAFETYKQLAETAEERALADYNSGKMFADLEMYDEAASQFRQALVNNPEDRDARFNYELALLKQQEGEQDQQEQDPDDNDDQNEEDNQEQQQDGDQEQDENQDNQQQDQQNQDQDQDQNEDEGDQQEQPQPLNMSEQEAENILDALRQLERELLENRRLESTENQSGNAKDW